MQCKSCGAANPPFGLYCRSCGSKLEQERGNRAVPTPPAGLPRAVSASEARCPRCGHPNSIGLRFCNQCGFALAGADEYDEPATAQQKPPGEIRSAVAVSPSPLASTLGHQEVQRHLAQQNVGSENIGSKNIGGPNIGQPMNASANNATPMESRADRLSDFPPRGGASTAMDGPRPQHGDRTPHGMLVSLLKDGSDGRAFPLYDEQIDLGRTEGTIVLSDDPYLSPRHARLVKRNEGLSLFDLGSVNGCYVRLRETMPLSHGDSLLVGQHVLRFEVLEDAERSLGPAMQQGTLLFGTPEVSRFARVSEYTSEGLLRDVFYLFRDETVFGREHGDIVFGDDPFVSRRHCAITFEKAQKRFTLRDLGSANGTSLRIRGEFLLRGGDHFRVGRHLFRYDAITAR